MPRTSSSSIDSEEVLAAVSQALRDAGYAVVGCRSTAAAAATSVSATRRW